MFNLNEIIRENIKDLKPYSSARLEYRGKEAVFLDANENPFNAPYNRYPDPLQVEMKDEISKVKGVNPSKIFLGNGSDEAIDLVFRAFCIPGKDNFITIDPTYDMYAVCAQINDIRVSKIRLLSNYQLDIDGILNAVDMNSKAIFICSPNNPTSNIFDRKDIIKIVENFNKIVVLDEAYVDFAPGKSLLPLLNNYRNLIILQTFSKAWGMAGVRLGMAFASQEIIQVFSNIKYPYNINSLTLKVALERIRKVDEKDFLMVKFSCPEEIYNYLIGKKIIIRDRSKKALCEGCLRFTVGSQMENRLLINALKEFIK
jgi:histidinol-phosphate aminotransferase